MTYGVLVPEEFDLFAQMELDPKYEMSRTDPDSLLKSVNDRLMNLTERRLFLALETDEKDDPKLVSGNRPRMDRGFFCGIRGCKNLKELSDEIESRIKKAREDRTMVFET